MDMESVYMAYYKSRIIAISKKEKLVRNYMEAHRYLTKKEYEIELQSLSETQLMLYHEDQILTEFYGYYIPNIDVVIIEMYSNGISIQINQAIEGIKNIAILSNQVKRLRPEVDQMIKMIKTLKEMQSSQKIINKLNYQDTLLNSILFCNMDEYLKALNQYEDIKRNNYEYMYQIME